MADGEWHGSLILLGEDINQHPFSHIWFSERKSICSSKTVSAVFDNDLQLVNTENVAGNGVFFKLNSDSQGENSIGIFDVESMARCVEKLGALYFCIYGDTASILSESAEDSGSNDFNGKITIMIPILALSVDYLEIEDRKADLYFYEHAEPEICILRRFFLNEFGERNDEYLSYLSDRFIQPLSIFRDLDQEDCLELVRAALHRFFPSGATIFDAAAQDSIGCCILLHGSAIMLSQFDGITRIIDRTYRPGQYFGELALFQDDSSSSKIHPIAAAAPIVDCSAPSARHRAVIVADEECDVLTVPRPAYRAVQRTRCAREALRLLRVPAPRAETEAVSLLRCLDLPAASAALGTATRPALPPPRSSLGLNLFTDLEPAARTELARCMRLRELGPGEQLCSQGDVMDTLYVVFDGALENVRDGGKGGGASTQALPASAGWSGNDVFSAGWTFGAEMLRMRSWRSPATLRAIGEGGARLLALDRADFLRVTSGRGGGEPTERSRLLSAARAVLGCRERSLAVDDPAAFRWREFRRGEVIPLHVVCATARGAESPGCEAGPFLDFIAAGCVQLVRRAAGSARPSVGRRDSPRAADDSDAPARAGGGLLAWSGAAREELRSRPATAAVGRAAAMAYSGWVAVLELSVGDCVNGAAAFQAPVPTSPTALACDNAAVAASDNVAILSVSVATIQVSFFSNTPLEFFLILNLPAFFI